MTNSVIRIYLFLSYLLFYNEAKSYHAVVIIHGVLTGSESMELISNRIQEVGRMALVTMEQKDLLTSQHYCFITQIWRIDFVTLFLHFFA